MASRTNHRWDRVTAILRRCRVCLIEERGTEGKKYRTYWNQKGERLRALPLCLFQPTKPDVVPAPRGFEQGERFEDGFHILHCGQSAVLHGNMSLREAGAPTTTLQYSCQKCHITFYLADGIEPPSQAQLDLNDEVE